MKFLLTVFQFWKMLLAGFIVVLLLSLAGVGLVSLLEKHYVRDYNQHLTQEVYVDVVENEDVNLFFYKRTCPYCKAGKQAIIEAARDSDIPTFYINVDTEDGQSLVQKYKVERAATIVQIRGGKVKLFDYAAEDRKGNIKADKAAIQEALNDSKNEDQ